MKRKEICQGLIDGTIHLIATEGLDGTTTKRISEVTGMNQVYIYRMFKDKEDLFAKTFEYLDDELIAKLLYHFPIMSLEGHSIEERSRMLFSVLWRFLLGNCEKCKCYVRYFYSPYFDKYSKESHKENFKEAVRVFSTAFKEEANTWMLLNHIMNVMFDFSLKVIDGEVGDNDDTAEHVFRLVYVSVNQYFREEMQEDLAI